MFGTSEIVDGWKMKIGFWKFRTLLWSYCVGWWYVVGLFTPVWVWGKIFVVSFLVLMLRFLQWFPPTACKHHGGVAIWQTLLKWMIAWRRMKGLGWLTPSLGWLDNIIWYWAFRKIWWLSSQVENILQALLVKFVGHVIYVKNGLDILKLTTFEEEGGPGVVGGDDLRCGEDCILLLKLERTSCWVHDVIK